jgi:hypothetical protein
LRSIAAAAPRPTIAHGRKKPVDPGRMIAKAIERFRES